MDALLLSLDSFVAGCAIAPLLGRASHRMAAAAMFGAADATATSLGALLVLPLHGALSAAPGVLALYGAYLLAVSTLARRELQAVRAPALGVAAALAVALAVDNLLAPAAAHPAWALATGGASAALLLLGFAAGARLSERLPARRRTAWIGAGLILTACSAVVA